jgi:WD40 repeat protein/transcriptional regulator with XRE-family HTH domain
MVGDDSFKDWLKRQRKALDLTQAELAHKAGCSIYTIQKIEEGGARPSRQLAELLVAALDTPPEERAALVQRARTPGPRSAPATPDARGPAVSANGHAPAPLAPETANPYKGLRAFQEADAPDFFGREALTERLRERLGEETALARFLAVVGPSGAGKSSVVRAGLLPALRQHGLPNGGRPVVVELSPGTHPLEELEAALLRVAANPPPSLMEQLRADERGLARAVKRVLPGDEQSELLLLIDQFEELFTMVPDERVRAGFIDSLFSAVADERSRLRVIITLRADFYDRPLLYLPSSELFGWRTEVVGPLAADELYRAITEPAERAGVALEKGLAAAIMGDVGEQPGLLPLLEYALTELYERRAGRLMTLAAYKASGGVFGSLARRAEGVYEQLSGAEQAAARDLFLRLVTPGEGGEDTRRRALLAEVMSAARDQAALQRVLDLYGRYRMLTFDRDPLSGGATVEVAHEALLRSWGRLSAWLAESREQLLVQRRLLYSAAEWQRSGQETSFLAGGVRLAQFAGLAAPGDGAVPLALTAAEQAYLAASLQEQQRREQAEQQQQARELALQKRAANRLRYLVGGLAVFLLVAAGLAAWAFNRSAVAEANFAHASAARIAGEANNLLLAHGDPSLIALLSIRSLHTEYSSQADAALSAVAFQGIPPSVFSGHTAAVQAAKFSPDGKYLATSSRDSTVRLWDIAGGKVVHIFTGHTQAVWGLDFSPDGKYLLSGSDEGTMRLWDLATYQTVRVFAAVAGGAISWTYFSPDGKYVLTDGGDNSPHLWDVGTGRMLRTFTGPTAGVFPAYSPDGKYVFASSLDNTARLWDAATGRQLREFPVEHGWVALAAYSPDGRYVAAGAGEVPDANAVASEIRVWDAATGRQVRLITGVQGVLALTFSPDSKYLLSGGEGRVLQLWDVATGQLLRTLTGHTGEIFGAAFSRDGKRVASASFDNTARVWDMQAAPGALVLNGHSDGVWSVSLSADGKYILTGSDDATARMWDAATGAELRRFVGHEGRVGSAVFSPDGKTVLTASNDRTARLWDAATGKELRRFTGHTDQVNRAFFSPDGKLIVTASHDMTARLWDAATGHQLRAFQLTDIVTKAVFSPDGKQVLAGSGNGEVRLWDAATGQEVRRFTGHTAGYVRVSFSRDGKQIVTAGDDTTARVWDVQTAQELQRFTVPNAGMKAAEFSSDGRLVLTAGDDGVARLWDVATGQEVRRFTGHSDQVKAAVFSPDGKYILTASLDKTARRWPIDYHDTIRALCAELTRDLTPEERSQYGITNPEPTCSAP